MIVTGPTVIVPLLRNVRVRPRVAAVLESEGVLIDPIGAIAVAVALPVVLNVDGALGGLGGLAMRLAVGTAVGVAGGFALRTLLRLPHIVPEGLETLVTLGGALMLFVGCDQLMPQTGILAVTLAGVVVGDAPRHDAQALRNFQEHLTMALIGVLFVLLAADVRVAEVVALGVPGIATVAILIAGRAAAERRRLDLGDGPRAARTRLPRQRRAARHRGRSGGVARGNRDGAEWTPGRP